MPVVSERNDGVPLVQSPARSSALPGFRSFHYILVASGIINFDSTRRTLGGFYLTFDDNAWCSAMKKWESNAGQATHQYSQRARVRSSGDMFYQCTLPANRPKPMCPRDARLAPYPGHSPPHSATRAGRDLLPCPSDQLLDESRKLLLQEAVPVLRAAEWLSDAGKSRVLQAQGIAYSLEYGNKAERGVGGRMRPVYDEEEGLEGRLLSPGIFAFFSSLRPSKHPQRRGQPRHENLDRWTLLKPVERCGPARRRCTRGPKSFGLRRARFKGFLSPYPNISVLSRVTRQFRFLIPRSHTVVLGFAQNLPNSPSKREHRAMIAYRIDPHLIRFPPSLSLEGPAPSARAFEGIGTSAGDWAGKLPRITMSQLRKALASNEDANEARKDAGSSSTAKLERDIV
ncbi:hypothetical protein DFH06DRAFT_1349189 [Mycena polygramma]|nr:hypothetical protein DFH06DRAFT_1349189 [Mycena polygramma]